MKREVGEVGLRWVGTLGQNLVSEKDWRLGVGDPFGELIGFERKSWFVWIRVWCVRLEFVWLG